MTEIQKEISNIDLELESLNEINLEELNPKEQNKIINSKNDLINKKLKLSNLIIQFNKIIKNENKEPSIDEDSEKISVKNKASKRKKMKILYQAILINLKIIKIQ